MYFQENVENNVCDLRFRPELSVILLKKNFEFLSQNKIHSIKNLNRLKVV